MMWPSGTRMVFKTISAVVAGIFLWQQVSWAADFADYTLDKLNAEQSQTFAPAYLQNQQAMHESLISDKQAIEDGTILQALTQNKLSDNTEDSTDDASLELQGPKSGGGGGQTVTTMAMPLSSTPQEEGAILSVTTESGDVIHYKGAQIDQIDTKDSEGGKITIRRITGLDLVDANNNLVNAEITYADGTIQIVANGKVSRITKPDGTVFEYSDTVTAPDGSTFTYAGGELITRATYPDPNNPDGNVVEYFYTVDGEGKITETKLKDSEKSSFYDKNGTLVKVEFNTGKLIEYDKDKNDDSDNGILSKVVTEDGKTYIYEKTEAIAPISGETIYTVKLREIRDADGNIFRLENNNIVEVDLSDGTILRSFQLDAAGHLVSGEIIYKDDPSILSVLVENQRIKELIDVAGIKTTYHYDEFNAAGDVIKATIEVEDVAHNIETYTYIRNEETNGVTITSGDKTWEYNGAWTLEKFSDSNGIIEHHYSPLAIFPPIYIGSTYTLTEGMVKEYDKNKNLIETTLSDGTIYEYYQTGQFAGNIQKALTPDGKVAIYDYKITSEGDLAVYKRMLYDNSSSYQSYYTNDPINYSTNPTLKATFKLDGSKSYSSAYASASYYQYNDKSVSLSLSFYNQKPYLYYYSYNYQTRQNTSYSRQLDITINKNTDYTVEYIWTATGVNIYLYESSGTRPSTPIYTIADNKWNPRFSVSGSNANLTLEPTSSGVYRKSASVSTDYNKPLKGNPIHTSEFTFDQNATSKYLYYSIYGNTDTTYDSIYLNYNNNTPSLSVYHYDYRTRQYTNQTIPISVTFNAGTTYVIQTKVEDNVLNLYIYEKGTIPQGPIYTMAGASWDARVYSSINGGSLNVEAYDNLEVYKYDNNDGDMIGRSNYADKDVLTYIYDEAGKIIRKELLSGNGTTKIYDKFNKLLSETKASGETTVYEYDEAGNVISITPQFPEGTAYSYYNSGAFQGKLKTAILPDGKIVYYDYNVNGSGNLQVYKRVSYDKNNLYQSVYSNNYIPSSTNPTLKTSFKLDSTKISSSVYASAYYYGYNDKSVTLSLGIYGQKPTISYYYYNYKTRQTVRDNKELNITIDKGITYNIEYVWTSTSVNVFIYEASQPRPTTPIYTIANPNWNPRFSVSGNNSALTLDPSSSGTYTTSKNISTDYSNPLKGSPIHTTTFSLNSAATYKSFYYSVYGSTASTYDSIYLSYYNNIPTLRAYHYDYMTSQYTNSAIPLNITFRDNVTYVIQTKIENNTLKFYIYESGTTPTGPVYTIENASWDPQIYTNINGGDMAVEACDGLEVYEYNTTSGIMLDKDVELSLRNKNILIDDPNSTLPDYAFVSGAPLTFPDGKSDIINNLMPAIDFSATLPSDIFNLDGSIIESSDSEDKAYFDTITYDHNKAIKEIQKLSGETIAYKDGLVDSILSDSSTTSYSYSLSDLNNIAEITVDRDGIRRIYDAYGNLETLSLDDATKIVYENGQVKEIQKADGTTITRTTGTGDMFFRENGELNDALVSYPDGSMAIYNDGELLQLISASGDTTDYSDGKIRHVKLADGTEYDWGYDGDNIIITDNTRQEKRTYYEGRLLQLEELAGAKLITKYYYDEGASKNLIRSEITQNREILYTYTYTYENDLTLVHDQDGNTQAYTKDKKLSYIVDSQGRKYSYTYVGKNEGYIEVYFPSGVKVRYDSEGKIIDITESDGSVVKDIVLDANGAPKNFTYIKDGNTFKVENGVIKEVLSKDGVDTLYYENGFIKSVQTELGELTEYQYFVKDNKAFNNASTLLNGNFDKLSFYNSNNTTYLELSENSLQFGTGIDGIKHVTTNEILAAGTYNFTSLVIDAGKTLTVTSGVTINALEEITVNGALLAPDVNINAYMISVGTTGSITGVGQHLNANTINILPGGSALSLIENANQGSATHTYNGGGTNTASDIKMFSSRHIDKVDWSFRIKLNYDRGGTDSIGTVYLCINGSWQQVYSTGHLGFTRDDTFTGSSSTGWDNVTGVRLDTWTNTAGPNSESWSWNYYAKVYGNPEMNYMNSTGSVPSSTHQVVYPSLGTFKSEVMEINALGLGSISWSQEELPVGANITFQTRTGDTIDPDAIDSGWSVWSSELSGGDHLQIGSPKGKYIQYKINLSTPNLNTTPRLKLGDNNSITFDYSRAPIGGSELSVLDYATASKEGIAYGYNKNGLLIWEKDVSGDVTYYDPPNTGNPLFLSTLIFDSGDLDRVKERIPGYLLNDTQKEVYLRDSVIISELTSIKSVDGTVTEYCQGQISKIIRPDGTVITDVYFDPGDGAKDFTYQKDNYTYIVKDGRIDTVISDTGERIKYYEYGFKKSAETDSSKKEYEYGIQAGNSYGTNSVLQNGVLDNTSFYNSNNTTYLELSENSLQFGTGVDGIKHVTTNETLAAGSYNFASLIIDAGKTLTVASGATINAIESITINGTLSAPDASINGYTITVGSTGSVAGVGQRITANTINIAPGGSTISAIGSANQGSTTHTYNGGGTHGATDTTMFSARHIDKVDWSFRIKLNYDRGGTDSIGTVYLCINGSWQQVYSTGHLGFTRDNTFTSSSSAGWDNVTGVRLDTWTNTAGPNSESWSWNYYATAYGNPEMNYVNSTGIVPLSTHQIGYPSSGTFESEVIELNALELGSISWNQELPAGTNVAFQTRTGNTLTPDDTWSGWSGPLTNPAGSDISSSSKKYFQYKINLSSSNSSVTPKVVLDSAHNISIGYTKFSENLLDSYVKVKENSITSAYNNSGILIWTEDITGARTYYDPANPQGTIDLAPLKFDAVYLDSLKEDLPSYKLSDAQKVITIYDKGSDLPVEIVTAGQSITYFDQGLATKVVDKNGVTQVVYTYDENKNVIKVEFIDARQKLEENYQKAVNEIVTQREAALAKIAQAEIDARADIATKSADIQKQIDDERTRLTQEKSKYDSNIYDLSEFDKAFREIDDYETKLQQQTHDAYIDLDAQLVAARARIESDASTAMQDLINNDYNKILADIVQKESSPLIYQYYRKVLGRDPGDEDLLYWTNTAKAELRPITATELTQYLENLPEYSDRATRKQNIITSITTFFTQYFSVSGSEKETMLSSLGFTPAEASNIIQSNLNQTDVNAIVSWLNGQSLHFGDSAFETIMAMLKSDSNPDNDKSFEEIGKDAIKIDILTGVITKDNTGDLLISMYAMRKAAEANGLTLYSQKISYDDLKDQVSRNNVIVHIDGKHYVLVTSINDIEGTITYIDPTVGQNGQEMTLSRAEFMGKWKGYSLSKELPADPAKQLNATQEKNIRGSGWWEDFWRGICNFFQKIVAPIAAILLFIPPLAPIGAIMLGINIIIQTISFVVRTGTLMDVVWSVVNTIGSAIGAAILPGIYEAAGQVFSSIGQAIFAPLQGVFSAVMPIFNNLSTAVSNIATGIGQIVSLGMATTTKIATSIGYNVIAQGVSIGSNYLFKSMNLDPSLANIGSALLTGAIMGAISPNTNIVSEAVKYGTIAGVEEIGRATNLDPNVTHLGAMMAGSLVGGALTIGDKTLTYTQLMESIAPKVLSEAAYIGVTEIGGLLGVDPRISYLAGIGISTGINAGYMRDSTGEWKFDSDKIWQGLQNGILRGATSVGLEALTQSIDPLYASLGLRALSGAIEGVLDKTGIFSGVLSSYKESALNTLTMGYSVELPIKPDSNSTYFLDNPEEYQDALDEYYSKMGEYYWAQSVYASKVIDFGSEVQSKTLVGALDTYITSIFRQDTINSIWELGGIYDMVVGNAVVINVDGIDVKRIYQDKNHINYIDVTIDTNDLMAKMENGRLIKGEFKVNPETGHFGLWNGTVEYLDGNEYVTETIKSGNLVDLTVADTSKDGQYKITSTDANRSITFTNEGKPQNAIVTNLKTGEKIVFEEGKKTTIISTAELNSDGVLRNLDYNEQKIREDNHEQIPTLTYEMQTPWATWVATIKIAAAETASDIWNVASLGALDKVEQIIKENPNASTGELLAKSIWAALTSVTNTLTLGYQDAVYYTQVQEGAGVDSILKGILNNTYNLTPIGDFSVAIDGDKPIADRLAGLFNGISKTAFWTAFGASIKGNASIPSDSIQPRIIEGDNFVITDYTGPLKPYGQSLFALMEDRNPAVRAFVKETIQHHNDLQVIGGQRGYDWTYHDFEGPFGKNNPVVIDGLTSESMDAVNFAKSLHQQSAHHYNWQQLKLPDPEAASDIVNALRQSRLYKQSWSFDRILRTIGEDLTSGKITEAQKQALIDATEWQRNLESQGLITDYGMGVD